MASQDWFEKDFYAILGVPQDADAATIKKTYRKLARDLHPDHNVGDARAEERFPGLWRPTRSDLCFATTNRQSALAEIAARCDAVVVIGSANSSNTQALAKLARESGCPRVLRVNGPDEFDRIQKGDVLVTESTTEAFNILLPLLGGIVTDNGGLLSHAAIVSREYGIPGVVGTREATERIADGMRVRVDGDDGTVTVLA